VIATVASMMPVIVRAVVIGVRRAAHHTQHRDAAGTQEPDHEHRGE
jgi:hypothetical protein